MPEEAAGEPICVIEEECGVPQLSGELGAICLKYNKYSGDCIYGARCKFKHICRICAKEGAFLEHPKSRCPKRAQEGSYPAGGAPLATK